MAFYRDPLISSHHFGGFSKNGYFDVSPITRDIFYTNLFRCFFSCFFSLFFDCSSSRESLRIIKSVLRYSSTKISISKIEKNIKSIPGFHNPDREIYFGGPRNPSVVLRFCDFWEFRRPTTSDEYFFQFFSSSDSTWFFYFQRFIDSWNHTKRAMRYFVSFWWFEQSMKRRTDRISTI